MTRPTHPCEVCGFELPARQSRCRSAAACERRRAAGTAQKPAQRLCVICLHARDDKGLRFLADYGRKPSPRDEWPMTEVAGHPVHKTCRSDLEHGLQFAERSSWADGAYRWLVNNSPAPTDCVQLAIRLGLADAGRLAEHVRTAEAETAKAIETYRRNWQPPSDEALMEMRAEFGEGTEVVDVIAGRRFRV